MGKGGFIVFDDIHLNTGMEKFWEELSVEKYDLSKDLDRVSGFGCIIKK